MISRQKMYEKLISNSMLSDEEFWALREAIKVCSCEDECVGIDCPLNSVKAGDGVDCCTLFAEYAEVLTKCRIKIAAFESPKSDVAIMVDGWLREMKDIQIALKREKAVPVISETCNKRVIYTCSNCGVTLSPKVFTKYCDCCGQRLKFEG